MENLRSKLPVLAGILALSIGLTGCGDDDATGPDGGVTEADLVASYEATTFTSTVDGESTDLLVAGGEFVVSLDGDGSTSGHIFVPGGGEDGGDFDVSLEGTWTFDEGNQEVAFQHEADTFLRNMTVSAVPVDGEVELRGEETFSGNTIEVVLQQS